MARTLTAVFEKPSEFLAREPHLNAGGVFLPLPDPAPEPLAEIELALITPQAVTHRFPAHVVQIAPAGISVAFIDAKAARAKLAPEFEAVRGVPDDPTMEAMQVFWEPEPAPEQEGDEPSGALYDQIRAMSQPEKMKLATSGDRSSRLLLMKDTNKTLHVFVLQNPRITIDEIIYMAGFRQTNPEALTIIATNRDWTQNPRVITALVKNPKTPSSVAVRLLDRLPQSEVRRLAKSADVPRAVSQAAKKKILG